MWRSLVAVCFVAACGTDELSPPSDGAMSSALACTGESALPFTELHPQVIAPRCAPCHNGSAIAEAPDVSSAVVGLTALRDVVSPRYAGTAGTLKIVDPGAPHNSTLMLKVLGGDPAGFTGPAGEDVGGAMPQAGMLSTAERDAIRNWICAGAPP